MKKRKKAKKREIRRTKKRAPTTGEIYKIISSYDRSKKENEKLSVNLEKAKERLQDLEIHTNLLTRLVTTLCVEKFGMRVGVLKRMIKRIEKEAIRDSQIDHLESLYKLAFKPNWKRQNPNSSLKNDPWDDIS